MQFLATCNPGLEGVAKREVKKLVNRKAQKLYEGALIFKGKHADMFRLNYLSRTLHRVMILLSHGSFRDLFDLYKQIKKVDFARYISSEQSFAIRASRVGEHDFTSIDVARFVGQAVIDGFKEAAGKRLKVNLDNPDVIFRAYVRDWNYFFALDTTGENSLHKRWYRVAKVHAPLKSTIAASMIMLSGFKQNEYLLDPFCGCATIPIEACLFAKNSPPNQNRGFAFEKFVFLDMERWEKFKEKVKEKEKNFTGKIVGVDIKPGAIFASRDNLKKAGLENCVEIRRGDAREIDLSCDRLVTDLPYGIRTSPKGLSELYKKFFKNLKKAQFKRAVIITTRKDLIKKHCKFEIKREIKVKYGDLLAHVFVL